MVRWLAVALILLLSGCSSLKDKRISVKCRCTWDYPYYVPKDPHETNPRLAPIPVQPR